MSKLKFIKINSIILLMALNLMLSADCKAQGELEENSTEPQKLSRVDWSGELGFVGAFWQAPSAKRNHHSLELSQALLRMETEPWESSQLIFEADFGQRDSISGRREMSIRQFQVEVDNFIFDSLSWGLIQHPWLRNEAETWNYELLGFEFKNPLLRYGYSRRSDQGLSGRLATAGGGVQAQFNYVNGEGDQQAETGPGKEFNLVIDFQTSAVKANQGAILSLLVSRGNYDGVEPTMSIKSRMGASLALRGRHGLGIAIESFQTEDPVDSVIGTIAEGLNLTDLGGKVIKGKVSSGVLTYRSGTDKWEVQLRGDHVEPILNKKTVNIDSGLLVVSLNFRPQWQTLLGVAQSKYGDDHSVSARDSQKWVMGARVQF
jgi:hypothetical protein